MLVMKMTHKLITDTNRNVFQIYLDEDIEVIFRVGDVVHVTTAMGPLCIVSLSYGPEASLIYFNWMGIAGSCSVVVEDTSSR